ncbi:MAG: DUF1292 domain-containing protein [Candidatus Izemoplasmatales bacterium]|nr:DUF1292 domain-containing protein [Candidatus Izemoplasmatales bacterium]
MTKKAMTDREIYELVTSENNEANVVLSDDEGKVFEMEQLGIIPLHGVVYAVLSLLKIEGKEVEDDEAGLVMLECDYDEESDEYYVSTVEDDELFDSVIAEFEKLPEHE